MKLPRRSEPFMKALALRFDLRDTLCEHAGRARATPTPVIIMNLPANP